MQNYFLCNGDNGSNAITMQNASNQNVNDGGCNGGVMMSDNNQQANQQMISAMQATMYGNGCTGGNTGSGVGGANLGMGYMQQIQQVAAGQTMSTGMGGYANNMVNAYGQQVGQVASMINYGGMEGLQQQNPQQEISDSSLDSNRLLMQTIQAQQQQMQLQMQLQQQQQMGATSYGASFLAMGGNHGNIMLNGGMPSNNTNFANPYGSAPVENGMLGAWSSTSAGLLGNLAPKIEEKKRLIRKKHKDKPKRPLSAYNLFFKDERRHILDSIPAKEGDDKDNSDKGNEEDNNGNDHSSDRKTQKGRRSPHGKIGFENLAKTIGQRWQELSKDRVEHYKKLAAEDTKRYKEEMEIFLTKQEAEQEGRENLKTEITTSSLSKKPEIIEENQNADKSSSSTPSTERNCSNNEEQEKADDKKDVDQQKALVTSSNKVGNDQDDGNDDNKNDSTTTTSTKNEEHCNDDDDKSLTTNKVSKENQRQQVPENQPSVSTTTKVASDDCEGGNIHGNHDKNEKDVSESNNNEDPTRNCEENERPSKKLKTEDEVEDK